MLKIWSTAIRTQIVAQKLVDPLATVLLLEAVAQNRLIKIALTLVSISLAQRGHGFKSVSVQKCFSPSSIILLQNTKFAQSEQQQQKKHFAKFLLKTEDSSKN